MSIQPRDVTPEISRALAALRIFADDASRNSLNQVSREAADAISVLDNVGIFAEIDEANDYASAEEILKEIEDAKVPDTADPAEWGDTTSADMARHQTLPGGIPGPGKGLTQDQARALFGDTDPADQSLTQDRYREIHGL